MNSSSYFIRRKVMLTSAIMGIMLLGACSTTTPKLAPIGDLKSFDNLVINGIQTKGEKTKEDYKYNPKQYEAMLDKQSQTPLTQADTLYAQSVLYRLQAVDIASQKFLNLSPEDMSFYISENSRGVIPAIYNTRSPKGCVIEAGVQVDNTSQTNSPYLAQQINYKFSSAQQQLFYDYSFLSELAACETYRLAALNGLNRIYKNEQLQAQSPKYFTFINNLMGIGILQPANGIIYGFHAYGIFLENKKTVKSTLILAQREFKAGREKEFRSFVSVMAASARLKDSKPNELVSTLQDNTRTAGVWLELERYINDKEQAPTIEALSPEAVEFMSYEAALGALDKDQQSQAFLAWYLSSFPMGDDKVDYKPFTLRETDLSVIAQNAKIVQTEKEKSEDFKRKNIEATKESEEATDTEETDPAKGGAVKIANDKDEGSAVDTKEEKAETAKKAVDKSKNNSLLADSRIYIYTEAYLKDNISKDTEEKTTSLGLE